MSGSSGYAANPEFALVGPNADVVLMTEAAVFSFCQPGVAKTTPGQHFYQRLQGRALALPELVERLPGEKPE